MTYLIAGAGPAGLQAALSIRAADTAGDILLLHPEGSFPYSRIALPELLTGEAEERMCSIVPEEFFENGRIQVRNSSLIGLRPEQKEAVLGGGDVVHYDRLLLATGAEPIMPAFVREHPDRAFPLWTRQDVLRIRERLPSCRSAVVIGAGAVGLHTAQALYHAGKSVTVLERLPELFPGMIDSTVRSMLLAAAERAGVDIRCQTEVRSLEERAVITDDGAFPADIVIVSTGIRARLPYLPEKTELCGGALPTDEFQRTAMPDIWAAGDVACSCDRLTGSRCVRALWPCAVEQGRVAGRSMAGIRDLARYPGSLSQNTLHLFDLPVASAGDPIGDAHTELCFPPCPAGSYTRLALTDGRLTGYLLAGRIEGAGTLLSALGKQLPDTIYARRGRLGDKSYVS